MQWVTRKGVKMDRSASAWLILRHIDPQAEFLYRAPEDMDAAIEAGARAFHNIGFLGPGSRQQSTFADLMDEYGLAQQDAGLAIMQGYIDRIEVGSESGSADDTLRAIAKGMNALVKGDQEMVDRMLPIYDALYAGCKRQAEGKPRWASSEPGWGG